MHTTPPLPPAPNAKQSVIPNKFNVHGVRGYQVLHSKYAINLIILHTAWYMHQPKTTFLDESLSLPSHTHRQSVCLCLMPAMFEVCV